MPLTHQPGEGNIVRYQADAVLHRCIIHGLDDFPVQHAFLYLHREAQSQLLPELFGGGGGMVAVDAHGPEDLQAAGYALISELPCGTLAISWGSAHTVVVPQDRAT